MLYSIVGLLVIIVDQAVKFWVSNTLFGQDIVKFIPGVISLVNVHNDGAAFGFLAGGGARIYFIVATGIFSVLVVIALATNFINGRVARWSIVMVTAGGLGNLIDRVIYGYVQDMFKVELFNFAVFNVADVFITVFAVIFVIAMLFEKPPVEDEDEFIDEDEEEEQEEKERKPLLERFKREKKEEEVAPRKAKKNRQAAYEEEYESYRSEREEKPQRKPVVKRPMEAEDPFAEWEKANARNNANRAGSYAAKAMGEDAPKYTAPAARRQEPESVRQSARETMQSMREPQRAREAVQPVREELPRRPVPQVEEPVAARPVQPVEAPAPAPVKPASKSVSADFDLDDILAEFK